MRVLGVDPGLTRCGLGVVDGAPGRPPSLVAAGVVRTEAGDDLAARLLALEAEIGNWLAEYRPDAVAVERVFSQHNVRTVMGTAQAGAVAVLCAARLGLPVALHTPSEVKAAVTGSGRADKAQVTAMVMRLLRLADPPRPADTADALALAICQLWRGGTAGPARRCRPRGGPVEELRSSAVISHLDGLVAAIAPEGAVIEVGGVGLLVQATPGTLATLRRGERARVATSLVVREDALTLVRLRQRRRAGRVRAAADGQRGRPPAGSGHARLVQPGRAAPGHRRRGRGRADPGPRDRPEGRAADHAGTGRAAGLTRRARRRGRDRGAGLPAARAASWRDQVRAGLVTWAGRPVTPIRPSPRSRSELAEAGDGAELDVTTALRAALRKLSRT